MLIWLKKVEHYIRMEKIITKLGDIEVKKNHKKNLTNITPISIKTIDINKI